MTMPERVPNHMRRIDGIPTTCTACRHVLREVIEEDTFWCPGCGAIQWKAEEDGCWYFDTPIFWETDKVSFPPNATSRKD